MNIPLDLKYTATHEWLRVEGDLVTVGITDHAQHELGDIVFVELPAAGRELKGGEGMGTIEAVKTVSDIYAPVDGTVVEANSALAADAGVINQDPYGTGWIVKIRFARLPGNLLDAEAYKNSIGE